MFFKEFCQRFTLIHFKPSYVKFLEPFIHLIVVFPTFCIAFLVFFHGSTIAFAYGFRVSRVATILNQLAYPNRNTQPLSIS